MKKYQDLSRDAELMKQEIQGLENMDVDSMSMEDMSKFFIEPAKSEKVPRNSLCLCGSNKKYKYCCL